MFQHPIDRVGDAASFDAALRIVDRASRFEIELWRKERERFADPASPEYDEEYASAIASDSAERSIRADYEAAVDIISTRLRLPLREAEERLTAETADALREAGLEHYADALESGDYGRLAF
jgi:hypothetical protein